MKKGWKWLMRPWKQAFCLHERPMFIRNLYGEEVDDHSGYQSLWMCRDCGKQVRQKDLVL